MKITIDWENPILTEKDILQITLTDLDDFYVQNNHYDQTNLYFVLLASAYYYEEKHDKECAAHLYYLIAYYLYSPLTPPASDKLCLCYMEKAMSLNDLKEYRDYYELMKKGN